MTFGEAFRYLEGGHKLFRSGWDRQWIFVYWPKEADKLTEPFICLRTIGGRLSPWAPTHDDLLASDWEKRGEL